MTFSGDEYLPLLIRSVTNLSNSAVSVMIMF